jgi:hypothetical protein
MLKSNWISALSAGRPKQRAWAGMGEKNHRKRSKGRRRQICLGKLKGRHVRKS